MFKNVSAPDPRWCSWCSGADAEMQNLLYPLGCSSLLPQSKSRHIRPTAGSKLLLGVCVCVSCFGLITCPRGVPGSHIVTAGNSSVTPVTFDPLTNLLFPLEKNAKMR